MNPLVLKSIVLLRGIISIYMIIIFLRVLLTWFQGAYLGKTQEIITKITDPYL